MAGLTKEQRAQREAAQKMQWWSRMWSKFMSHKKRKLS